MPTTLPIAETHLPNFNEELLLENCLCFDVRRTSRLITRIYEQHLAPSGLTPTQRGAMKFLEEDTLTMAQLAQLIALDRTSLRRMLDPLERDGLIDISTGDDRRVRHISLTSAGRKALVHADKYWNEAQQEVMHYLGSKHWSNLVSTMRTARKVLESAPASETF